MEDRERKIVQTKSRKAHNVANAVSETDEEVNARLEEKTVAAQKERGFFPNPDLIYFLEMTLENAKIGLISGVCIISVVSDRKTGELHGTYRCLAAPTREIQDSLRLGIEQAYASRDDVYNLFDAHHPGRGVRGGEGFRVK